MVTKVTDNCYKKILGYKMRLVLNVIFAILLLSGCSSNNQQLKTRTDDTVAIKAVFISDDKLYVMSDAADYVFDSGMLQILKNFIDSPYANRILFVKAALSISKKDSSVEGRYLMLLDPNNFREDELFDLNANYYFNTEKIVDPRDKPFVRKMLPDYEKKQLLINNLYAYGKVVKLEGREQLLKRFSLPEQIITSVDYYTPKKDVGAVVNNIMAAPGAVVSIILAAPLYIILMSSSP